MGFINFPSPTPVFATLPGFGYAVKKTPIWASATAKFVSGRELRAQRQVFPLWEFEVPIDIIRDQTPNQTIYHQYVGMTEAQRVMAFFGALRGQYGEFYFDDLDDDSRLGVPLVTAGTNAAPNQTFLPTTDGTSTNYVPLRSWGGINTGQPVGIDLTTFEPVGGIKTVQAIHGTSISHTVGGPDGRTIVFSSAPAASLTLTIDLNFYYRCRFTNDDQEWDEFMYNLHQGKLTFRSVKP